MENLQKRKLNRLSKYDYSSNGAYFITICTDKKLKTLGKIVVDDAYIVPPYIQLSTLGETTQKYIENINHVYADITVDKYVIMPNHIHLIIVINSGAMKASMPLT